MTTTWTQFAETAPRIAEVFTRRHRATGNLCMLGTLRPDGFPRISPMEPAFYDGELWLMGMPGTAKFADLVRDPRYTLHTATVDTHVGDGDAKVWGTVEDVADESVQRGLAQAIFDATGFDVRGESFEHCFRASVVGAASVEIIDGGLEIWTWREGTEQKRTRKD